MRIKLCLLLIAYLLFSTPVTSHAATASIEDDIDLSFILGDEFKNPSKKTKEKAVKKAKEEKKITKEKAVPQKEEKKEATHQDSELSITEQIAEEQMQKDPSQLQTAPIAKPKLKKPQVDLLTKVREGTPFTPEEIEYWIYNTPDINQCYENGQTMLLYIIAHYTDIEALRTLIDNGADVQTHCTPRFESLFIAAINNPSAAVTELLINNGANVVERDFEKNTALILASTFNSSANVINTLLDYGLKTNTTNKYGYDALTLAVYENGRIPIIQTLIDNEADVNSRDPDGHTPLMAAAIRGRDDVMKYLIQRGADYKAEDNNKISVLNYYNQRIYLEDEEYKAKPKPKSPSERLFQEFQYITQKNKQYNDDLKRSIYAPDPDAALSTALEHLAYPDVKDENDCTTLLNATRQNLPLSFIEKLVKAKANVNATCLNGRNALMFLTSHAETSADAENQIIKALYLIENGLDINTKDENGNTALMHAVANHAHNNFILSLIKSNADVNIANQQQETALWITVRQQRAPETLRLLLEYGADPNAKDAQGETPLWYQLRNESNDTITQLLIRGGADADKPNSAGDTPLWYALKKKISPDVIEAIIVAQHDTNARNENGDTPLLYAVKNDYPANIVKALLANGADPNLKDRNGYTMYDILQGNQFFNETMQRVNRNRVLEDW